MRLLGTWAADAVAHARAIAAVDASWGTEVHAVAGGWLVLWGAGLYVNRAIAIGVTAGVSVTDLELIVERSEAHGVVPSMTASPATRPASLALIGASRFVHDLERDVTALIRPLPGPSVDAPDDVRVRPVVTADDLRVWQETTALGWGHVDPEARRASDAFASAAHTIDNEEMVLALDATDGRPVGCASTTLRDGVATLGAMSTVPAERRRGVQAALIRYRLEVAARRGCDLAASTAAAGGPSQRNLQRHGFTPQFTIATYGLERG